MKKIKMFALMLLAGATLLTSCGKDDETTADPTIAFQGGTTSLVFNGTNTVDVNVTFTAEGKIESVSLQGPSLTGAGTTTTPITDKMGTGHNTNAKNETSATYLFQVPSADLIAAFLNHTTLTYTFTLTDQDSRSTTGTFTVTMPSAGTPFANTYTDGVFYHIAGLLHGAYDLDGHATVGSAGTASTKSMKNSDAAGSAFTGSWASDAANGTMYVKSNSYDYTNATVESATAAYTAGTPSATVTNPVANDIFIGKKGSSYYVVKITAVEPAFNTGTGGNTGRITFGYKK